MIARSGLEPNGAEGGGYLEPGDWTTTFGYRHQFSHVHFSGPQENFSREELGTEVQSKTNIEDVMVTYQITPQFNCIVTLPFLSASRREQNQYGTLHTSGISDFSGGAQYWLRNPKSPKAGINNVQIGLSLLTPTGNDRESDNVITTYGGTVSRQYPDYSVQPGAGTWGMIMQWQAFQYLGNQMNLYFDGDYVMTQGGYHDFWTSHGGTSNGPPAPAIGLTQFDAIQDQYMAEIGMAHPAPKIAGLSWTLAVRDEGVPARNLIGDDLGFRRPGFSVNLEPGFIYTRGPHMLQFEVGRAMFRDRTKSVPEKMAGSSPGDAAFANYVWLMAYTLRLPKKDRTTESSLRPGASPAAAPAAPAVAPATPSAAAPATASAAAPAPAQTGASALTPSKFKSFNLKTLSGARRDLHDYADKVTLVSFFFPRCPYCNIELPEVQKIYDRYKDKGLSMVWINILPEEEHLIRDWQALHHYTVPVLVGASEASVERDYRVTGTPTTYVLNEKGEVLFYKSGYDKGDEKNLENLIVKTLNLSSESVGPPAVSRNDSPAVAH